MTQTTSYQLPQWAANDPLRREDFNQAMGNIEAGLSAAAELPYAIGSYTGDGDTNWRSIELGFQPRFLIITAQSSSSTLGAASTTQFALVGGKTSVTIAYLYESGFRVKEKAYPQINLSGTVYYYIAFR